MTSSSVQGTVVDVSEIVQVVDLMEYTPLGGVFYYDVFCLPPQARHVHGWEIRQVNRKEYPVPSFSSRCCWLPHFAFLPHHILHRSWTQGCRCSPTPQSRWTSMTTSPSPARLSECLCRCPTVSSSWRLPKWLAGMLQV